MNTLRKLPIQNAAKLKSGRWLLVYEARNYEIANNTYENMRKAAVAMGIIVEEPHWIELATMNATDAFEKELGYYINKFGEPSICCILLSYERFYRALKNICYNKNVIS